MANQSNFVQDITKTIKRNPWAWGIGAVVAVGAGLYAMSRRRVAGPMLTMAPEPPSIDESRDHALDELRRRLEEEIGARELWQGTVARIIGELGSDVERTIRQIQESTQQELTELQTRYESLYLMDLAANDPFLNPETISYIREIEEDIARVQAARGRPDAEAYFQRQYGGIDAYIASQEYRLQEIRRTGVDPYSAQPQARSTVTSSGQRSTTSSSTPAGSTRSATQEIAAIQADIARVQAARGRPDAEAYFQRHYGGIDAYIASQQARLARLQG